MDSIKSGSARIYRVQDVKEFFDENIKGLIPDEDNCSRYGIPLPDGTLPIGWGMFGVFGINPPLNAGKWYGVMDADVFDIDLSVRVFSDADHPTLEYGVMMVWRKYHPERGILMFANGSDALESFCEAFETEETIVAFTEGSH